MRPPYSFALNLRPINSHSADTYDMLAPLAASLSLSSRTHASTASLLLILSALSAPLILALLAFPALPLRILFLTLGLTPFLLTHPSLPAHAPLRAHTRRLRVLAMRFVDDDRMSDACWRAPLREIELWENERRFEDGWSKSALRAGERPPWTRTKDGSGDGGAINSNLTVTLPVGWAFVPTEDWRPDLCASWAEGSGDDGE